MSKENPLWGAERIQVTLLLLGFEPPCEDTVRKYMIKPKKIDKKSTTWLPFLQNHLDSSCAIDFFTVTTLTFNRLNVFVVLDHAQRQVFHFRITYHPSMKLIIQQLREAMPSVNSLATSFATTTASTTMAYNPSWIHVVSKRFAVLTGALGKIHSWRDSSAHYAVSCSIT